MFLKESKMDDTLLACIQNVEAGDGEEVHN